jgi:SAM-dependent methyltransferase
VTETAGDRVRRYLLDGGDEDLRRLLGISEVHAEMARTALGRAGIAPGWNVVDCGCGPLGALPQLAELVGAAGRVTGVDLNPEAVRRAQAAAEALGLGNVRALAADVHEVAAADIGGPFDLAYTRLFMVHQHDPVLTLRRIAGLLRPGGWLITQEALPRPLPRSFPDLDAVGAAWGLMVELVERSGVPAGTADRMPTWAAAAGLEVVRMDGSFGAGPPARYFDLYASTLAVMRDRSVAAGLTTGQEIDAIIDVLASADPAAYEWVTTPFTLDLTLRKPALHGYPRVRITGPSSVTAMVCSTWAARLPSPVRMVQPSSSE